MKRTAAIITVLAIVGSIVFGFVIGRLSGGGDGLGHFTTTATETSVTSTPTQITDPTAPATPTSSPSAIPSVGTPQSATPRLATPEPATPVGASTPLLDATPVSDGTPVADASPPLSATASATSTTAPPPGETRSLGAIEHAPTSTPTLVPNPPPLATLSPTVEYPDDDGTSITFSPD